MWSGVRCRKVTLIGRRRTYLLSQTSWLLVVLQARSVLDQLHGAADQRHRMDLAHTLKGSARSVGAWQVAQQAEACEAMIGASDASWNGGLDALAVSIREAVGAIGELRRAA